MNRPLRRSTSPSTRADESGPGRSAQPLDATPPGSGAGDLVINGKFTSQRITGVQRVARELTAALQQLLGTDERLPVIVPRDALPERARLRDESASPSRLTGSLWEQLALPLETHDRMLLSLCNMGPLLKRRQIVMIHDAAVYDVAQNYSWKFRWWYRLAFRVMKHRAAHFVTVSDFSKRRIVAHLGIDEARVSVVHNAADHFDRIVADPDVLARLALRKDSYGLVVGSLSAAKNLTRVLAALGRLERRSDARFVIVGGGNPRIFGAAIVGDGKLPGNVLMAGAVTDGELKALYQNAACFIFPSLYEGFGLPPLEAMRCGCPVIASREASLPEVCADAALYCDAYSIEDIAEKIALMMSEPALRERFRARGLERAKEFDWAVAARELLAVAQRVAGRGRDGGGRDYFEVMQ
ncbi:glycosyltransferase family 1 protein [Pandoraea sp.]|uniref:glycosyltransferase family 4 protein n=1 Tax=Pandoraea sp. TaxID=1883445 RepID=UPI00120A2C61|nr:glycosyltransferase family 1 protein [Pandoraea sp.]TAL55045.1 MAG: glycosyltransferase family 1 protein [Pandoraea sp.]TAM19907.1 MAG: glycosyltransferase family 1 protein [Pandoraea sp.]